LRPSVSTVKSAISRYSGSRVAINNSSTARQLLVDAGVQVNDEAPRPQMVPILQIHDGAAAGSKDDTFPLGKIVDDFRFPPAKAGLTFFLEDERNIDSRARFNFLVAIDKLEVQKSGQLPPDGRLSRTHRADEKQILRMLHVCLTAITQKRKPTRGLAFTGLL
jgi:hypothetical protein